MDKTKLTRDKTRALISGDFFEFYVSILCARETLLDRQLRHFMHLLRDLLRVQNVVEKGTFTYSKIDFETIHTIELMLVWSTFYMSCT